MWIIPSNHPLYSAFAQDFLDSKEDLLEQSEISELSLMWRSKPSSLQTLSQRWKKVFWLRHLFGRMLKPLMEQSFGEKLTELSEDTLVNRSRMQDKEAEQKTPDTFTRLFQELSKQQDLFGASLKMSPDTSPLDSPKYRQTYDLWVTQLRQESTQRKKLAHHKREIDFLSSQSNQSMWLTCRAAESGDYQNVNRDKHGVSRGIALTLTGKVKANWPTPDCSDRRSMNSEQQGLSNVVQKWLTPTTSDGTMSKKDLSKLQKTDSGSYRLINKSGTQSNAGLVNQVQFYPQSKWATPQARDSKSADKESTDNYKRKKDLGYTIDLNSQVLEKKSWPTPATRDYKGANGDDHFETKEMPHMYQLPNAVKMIGRHDQGKNNTDGKNLARLSPSWVAMLMGTRKELTFYI